jgi:hypothetical protein
VHFRLGLVKRGIGIGQQRARIVAVGRIDGDARAHADMHPVAVDLELLLEGGDQPFTELHRGLRLRAAGDHQREFVAADAGQKGAGSRHP